MKRAFIVHGWEFNPRMHWYPWLKKELEKKGYEAHVLKMPDTKKPDIKKWVATLAKEVGTPDKDTYFIGHSIGCQTIIRYLSTKKAGGAVYVGGWFMLTPEATPTPTYRKIAKPWLLEPIDFDKARKTKSIAILSDNDPYVPVENAAVFRKTLGAKIIMEKKKGHFTADDGVTKLPTVMKALATM